MIGMVRISMIYLARCMLGSIRSTLPKKRPVLSRDCQRRPIALTRCLFVPTRAVLTTSTARQADGAVTAPQASEVSTPPSEPALGLPNFAG